MTVLEECEALLHRTVNQQGVDYKQLKADGLLEHVAESFATQKWPQSAASLAFWLNAYNLLTLTLICRNYPLKSINDLNRLQPLALAAVAKKTVWDTETFNIGPRSYTLNDIEQKIIRPKFKEPRIHAALVCAAKSCPPLRDELYRDSLLDSQLDQQMQAWLRDKNKNRFNAKKGVLHLSPIFLWYRKDFTAGGMNVKKWATRYLSEADVAAIGVQKKKLKIRYLGYDWGLNDV